MGDVKPQESAPIESTSQGGNVANQAAAATTPAETKTAANAANVDAGLSKPEPTERMVPYQALRDARDQLRNAKRELAGMRGRQATAGLDPDDLEAIKNHPYVQQLEQQSAVAQLRQGAEEILSRYPQLPQHLARAILRNPRALIGPETASVPEALVDIDEYVQEIVDELGADTAATPKQVQVAGTNSPAGIQQGTSPAELDAILKKPVSEWTDEDEKLLKQSGAPKI